jgi:hypothetical protein
MLFLSVLEALDLSAQVFQLGLLLVQFISCLTESGREPFEHPSSFGSQLACEGNAPYNAQLGFI